MIPASNASGIAAIARGGCAMSAAYLDLPVAQEIFGRDPRAVLAWGPGPRVKAIETDGGYRVTGVWAFASGGRHATWLGAHCPVFKADGTPLIGATRYEQLYLNTGHGTLACVQIQTH